VSAPPGVNVVGHALSEKGLGEVVRAMVRGFAAAGIPHGVVDYSDRGSANLDRTLVSLLGANAHPVNLIVVTALGLPPFVRARGAGFLRGKYNIGYWLWELPDLPEDVHGSFSYLDEVWVASDYGREAIARASPVPVVKVPPPLPAEGLVSRKLGRAQFGLEAGHRVFLFMFDAHSIVERKNPDGLIAAFKRAFPRETDVRLVLKVGRASRPLLGWLRSEAADERIVVIDRILDREELVGLVAASDCYVSLHRSEGFGLTMAEAMAVGKPVIGTAYSANLDFMTADNSLLVRQREVRLERDYPPYPKGSTWADPDIGHAAELMRWVYSDPAGARCLGERARADILAYLSPAAVGARMAQRFTLIAREIEARRSVLAI
jgi:glycosyltransferase involved in cell wall biosynthesis